MGEEGAQQEALDHCGHSEGSQEQEEHNWVAVGENVPKLQEAKGGQGQAHGFAQRCSPTQGTSCLLPSPVRKSILQPGRLRHAHLEYQHEQYSAEKEGPKAAEEPAQP